MAGAPRSAAKRCSGRKSPHIVGFSLTYANVGEEARVGSARLSTSGIGCRTLTPFWRSYIPRRPGGVLHQPDRAGVAALHNELYDRILPNKAVSSLWVLAIARLHLDSFRSSVEDGPRRAGSTMRAARPDLRISYLLFEKVLNSSLAARPQSTGEYANRVSQYEFVREFFTSNTISVLIDTLSSWSSCSSSICWPAGW